MNSEFLQLSRLRDCFLLVWITGTALFFFSRFTLTFYMANESAIIEVLNRLFP